MQGTALRTAALAVDEAAPPSAWAMTAEGTGPAGAHGLCGRGARLSGVGTDLDALAVESARIATWSLDLASDVMRVNACWAERIGLSPDELPQPLRGADWRNLTHPEDLALVDALLSGDEGGAEDRDRPTETEYRIRHRDGRWIRVLNRSRTMARSGDGRPLLVAGVEIDAGGSGLCTAALDRAGADLGEAIAELKLVERRFREVAEASESWFWEQDSDLRFTYRSHTDSAVKTGVFTWNMLGLTHAEWLAQHPDVRESADWDRVLEAQAERLPFHDFISRAPLSVSGAERWFRISGNPVFDDAGVFQGYRGVGTDVTELEVARRRAEESSRTKSAFLASVSHEIRTPLNGVLGMAELLDRLLDTDQQREILKTIRRSGNLLLAVLNDILDLSKIEAGRLELEHAPLDLTGIAREAHALHEATASEKGLGLELMIASSLQARRMGDALRIQQILNNLLSNAVKFTERGDVVIRISGRAGKPVTIEVRDTGIGMTEAQLDRICGEYAQADASISRRFGGTGLGTAIISRLVAMMGGELRIASTVDVGTSVTVVLPLDEVADRIAAPEPPPRGIASLAGLHLLAADDNEINSMVIRLMLESCGATVETAADGLAAIDLWKSGRFDAVLLDIAMPVMDGVQALTEIRRAEAERGTPPVPVFAVTANAMPHQIADYIAAGFDACIAKPVNAADLSMTIGNLLEPGNPSRIARS